MAQKSMKSNKMMDKKTDDKMMKGKPDMVIAIGKMKPKKK